MLSAGVVCVFCKFGVIILKSLVWKQTSLVESHLLLTKFAGLLSSAKVVEGRKKAHFLLTWGRFMTQLLHPSQGGLYFITPLQCQLRDCLYPLKTYEAYSLSEPYSQYLCFLDITSLKAPHSSEHNANIGFPNTASSSSSIGSIFMASFHIVLPLIIAMEASISCFTRKTPSPFENSVLPMVFVLPRGRIPTGKRFASSFLRRSPRIIEYYLSVINLRDGIEVAVQFEDGQFTFGGKQYDCH